MSRKFQSKKPNHHMHHIIPVHMGGTNAEDNLVELTVEAHAEAHRVLFEQYGRWQDKAAWQALSKQIGKSEVWKMAAQTPEVKAKQQAYWDSIRGVPKNEATKLAMRKPKSRTEKQKIAAQNRTPEHQANINKSLIGRPANKGSGKKEQWVYEKIREISSRSYRITKEGEEFIIKNLAKWSRENGLSVPSVKHVLISGKPYKGIMVERL